MSFLSRSNFSVTPLIYTEWCPKRTSPIISSLAEEACAGASTSWSLWALPVTAPITGDGPLSPLGVDTSTDAPFFF